MRTYDYALTIILHDAGEDAELTFYFNNLRDLRDHLNCLAEWPLDFEIELVDVETDVVPPPVPE